MNIVSHFLELNTTPYQTAQIHLSHERGYLYRIFHPDDVGQIKWLLHQTTSITILIPMTITTSYNNVLSCSWLFCVVKALNRIDIAKLGKILGQISLYFHHFEHFSSIFRNTNHLVDMFHVIQQNGIYILVLQSQNNHKVNSIQCKKA